MRGEYHGRVLVVDSDPAVRLFLNRIISMDGHNVLEAASGAEGVGASRRFRPDLLVLEPLLPDMDGIGVITELRQWSDARIMIFSTREEVAAKVGALEAGADFYVSKQTDAEELTARLRAALRLARGLRPPQVFVAGDLEVDTGKRCVRRLDRVIPLTPTEYNLLEVLLWRRGLAVTCRQAIAALWGHGAHQDGRHLLRVNISNLRRKLEPGSESSRFILTVPGVGYRFGEPEEPTDVG